jgi:hypothetical protein
VPPSIDVSKSEHLALETRKTLAQAVGGLNGAMPVLF